MWHLADRHALLAVPLCVPLVATGHRAPVAVAIIDLSVPDEESVGSNRTREIRRTAYFNEMLLLLAQKFQVSARTDEQMEMVGTELAQVYEELVLLHQISMNMRVTESDTNFLQMACDSLTEVAPVEGIAILLERIVDGDRRFRGRRRIGVDRPE